MWHRWSRLRSERIKGCIIWKHSVMLGLAKLIVLLLFTARKRRLKFSLFLDTAQFVHYVGWLLRSITICIEPAVRILRCTYWARSIIDKMAVLIWLQRHSIATFETLCPALSDVTKSTVSWRQNCRQFTCSCWKFCPFGDSKASGIWISRSVVVLLLSVFRLMVRSKAILSPRKVRALLRFFFIAVSTLHRFLIGLTMRLTSPMVSHIGAEFSALILNRWLWWFIV